MGTALALLAADAGWQRQAGSKLAGAWQCRVPAAGGSALDPAVPPDELWGVLYFGVLGVLSDSKTLKPQTLKLLST